MTTDFGEEQYMKRIQSVSAAVAVPAAMLTGAAFGAEGVVQMIHSQAHSGSRVVGLAGHLNLAFFGLGLLLIAPVLVELGRRGGSRASARAWGSRASARAGVIAAAGTVLLSLTCVVALIDGRDPGFFNVVAPITNLAWLGGSVVIAVALRRSRQLPGWVAVGLPLAWAATLLLARFGGGVLSGGFFVAVGYAIRANATFLSDSERNVASSRATTQAAA